MKECSSWSAQFPCNRKHAGLSKNNKSTDYGSMDRWMRSWVDFEQQIDSIFQNWKKYMSYYETLASQDLDDGNKLGK